MNRMQKAIKVGLCERTKNEAEIAEWKKESERDYKTDIMEQLAKSCGYGVRLVQHWGRNKITPAAIEFFDTCTACYENELPGYFLSGTVLEDWYAKDWRGVKGQIPTPPQLFERALMVYARLQDEQLQDQFRQPAVKRIYTDFDTLPLPQAMP